MSNLLLSSRRFCAALAVLAVSALSASAQTFSNPAPITINDATTATPYPSTILVAGLTGNIASMTLTLFGLSHTFPDDIDVLLVGPTGVSLIVMSDTGGLNSLVGVTYVFAGGSPALSDAGANPSGTYAPTNFGAATDVFAAPAPVGPYGNGIPGALPNFSGFTGTNGNGLWSLYVVDDLSGDVGSISGGWSMTFTVVPEPSTTALLVLAAGAVGLAAWRKRKTA